MKMLLVCLLVSVVSFGMALADPDPPTKLNAPLVAGGEVVEFATSPDGAWVVYKADQEVDNQFELYSVPAAGGSVTKLNGPLVADTDVVDFLIGGDSDRVVFRVGPFEEVGYQTYDHDLFSVPIAGGTPTRLNDDEISATTSSIQITPDGESVVFWGRAPCDWDPEWFYSNYYFSVPIEGGDKVKLSGCPASSDPGPSGYFQISGDSQYIVYTWGWYGTTAGSSLISNRLDGSGGYSIDTTVEGDIFAISPDSQQVLYTDYFARNLKIASITDDFHLTLEPNWVSTEFEFSPVAVDGLFRAIYRSSSLTSVAIDGSQLVQLAEIDCSTYFSFDFTPDGARVVYKNCLDSETDIPELFSVETLGGTPIKLSGALTAGGGVESYQVSSDRQREHLVYYADEETDGILELYSVPVTGGERLKLSGTLPAEGEILDDYSLSADGASVVYRASYETEELYELYETPTEGGDGVKLSGDMPSFGDVQSFDFTGDGQRVVYLANPEAVEVVELYSVPRAFADPLDSDDDGLPDDEDLCPGTGAGDPVDPDTGCSIDQICPCEDPDYFSCVKDVTTDFVQRGLITGREKGAIISEAATSECRIRVSLPSSIDAESPDHESPAPVDFSASTGDGSR